MEEVYRQFFASIFFFVKINKKQEQIKEALF
jgi:hypothetical protein